MAIQTINKVGYGLSDALPEIFNSPIVSIRNPTTADKAPIGQVWVNKLSNAYFVLTSVVNNLATWVTGNSGSGVFTTVTASGNITSTGGDIIASAGNMSAAGNITSTAGDITATLGNISAVSAYVTGDDGGVASTTGISNVIDTTQGAGALSILSTNGNPGDNAGFLKFYVGTTPVWVPYFDDIAP